MKKKAKRNNLINKKIDHREIKIKTTIWLDGDILIRVRKSANESEQEFQSIINNLLRFSLTDESIFKQQIIKQLEKIDKSIQKLKTLKAKEKRK